MIANKLMMLGIATNLCWDYTIQHLARLMNYSPLMLASSTPHGWWKRLFWTHTHTRIWVHVSVPRHAHTHTLVLVAHCQNRSRGSPGRGERDSKGILERWLNWLLNRPTADTPWNPRNSEWTWKWSHLWAHHTSVSGWGQGAEKGLTASGYPSRDPTAVTPAPSEGNTCY